jgi:hypothetical protein
MKNRRNVRRGVFCTVRVVLNTQYLVKNVWWSSGTPCGGGFEYLHRSPASSRRRRKWNPVPGIITGPSCSRGDRNTGNWPSPGWESLECETVKYGQETCWTRTREWLHWRMPAAIVNDRPILSSERTLHKDYESKYSVKRILVVGLNELDAKTKRWAVNRQS